MDYYEPRDDPDDPVVEDGEPSPIQKVFEGAHIFITGASGFMGKVLLEKLLRTCNVAQIYILMRDKKGVKSEDRLIALFNDIFFEPLKLKKPGEVRKVSMVTGDCLLPNLGLLYEDRMRMSHVNIIFHAAATLYMDQHLKVAYNTNVIATGALLEFAKTLPQLRAFMYISTAYTHAYRDLVEEQFYSLELNSDELGQICTQLDDAQIGALTPILTGRWGNTYALTKACAEDLVSKYNQILPVGVVRPSIVVSVWQEPLRGWINNLYGAVGVVAGTGLGLLRVWCADPNMVADMIPVDVAINITLAATWEVATTNTSLKIYNLVSSPTNPITYSILQTASERHGAREKLFSTHSIAHPMLVLPKNKILFQIYTWWYHIIPAFFIDIYLKWAGKETRLMKIYTKIFNLNYCLMPYCVNQEIRFKSDNVNQLWDSLDPTDKRLFYFDISAMDWNWFWLGALKGLRVYLMNDPMETVPEGLKHNRKQHIRKIVLDSIIWTTLSSLVVFSLKDILFSLF